MEVHSDRGSHLLHTSLGELATRLDPEVFRQVHRSHIINLDAIVKLVRADSIPQGTSTAPADTMK